MQVKIINGTSKKGKPYQAIKISIGEYEALVFPTRAELAYIKTLLAERKQNEKAE